MSTSLVIGDLRGLSAKEIAFEDMPTLNYYFEQYPALASEYSFANLFVWRKDRPIHWFIRSDHLYVCYPFATCLVFMQPIGPDPVNAIVEMIETFPHGLWGRIETDIAHAVDRLNGSNSRDDDYNSDYLYLRSELLSLNDVKFRGIRKELRRFERSYAGRYRVELISQSNIPDCRDIVDVWTTQKNGDDAESCHRDAVACHEFLSYYEDFQAHGTILYVDDVPASFRFGTKGARNHFVSHFTKSNLSIPDISKISFYEFVKSLSDQIEYINLMQDCGDEGLRKWKRSFRPIGQVKKSVIAP